MRHARRLTFVLASIACFTVTSPAQAQSSGYGWAAWYGCWHAQGAPANEQLCIARDGDGVRMITVVDGVKREETRVVADDQWHDVVQDNCRGVQRARWSTDRRRVFLNAELKCGSVQRASSGVLAFTDDARWVSAQAITVDGQTGTRSTQYELVRDDGASGRSARIAAARRVTEADIDEAADYIHEAAVQEWLVASGEEYEIALGSALDMLDRGSTRTIIVERPVYIERSYSYGHRYCPRYSPWGYDLFGWRVYRPVLFIHRHHHHYAPRPPIIIRHEGNRHRDYRDRDYRDRDYRDNRDRRAERDPARVTRNGYSREGVRSARSTERAAKSTQSQKTEQRPQRSTQPRTAEPRSARARN